MLERPIVSPTAGVPADAAGVVAATRADAEAARLIEALWPAPTDADAAAVAAAITKAAGSSFGPGMRALPAPRRRAMWAFYAFSRVIDDIADEPMPDAARAMLLDAWRREVAAAFAGRAQSGVGQALMPSVSAYALPIEEFRLLIDGMEMDAAGPIVAPPMATLRAYTRRVAGAVGMVSMRIFGAWQGPLSARFALSLGDALQLTNIVRDVAEDASRGRLYLPAEMLARHAIPAEPAAAAAHPALPVLLAELSTLARAEFDAARAAIAGHPRRALTPALMMLGVYEATLNRIEQRGFAPTPRVRLGKIAKLRAALAAVVSPAAHRQVAG
ncbi:MAG: squalene/phytoene synthase family protein [Pseudomonadota bacterium]